jgi:flagellar protein FliO/FliZ
MKIRLNLLFLGFFILSNNVCAADAVAVSPSTGILKMVLGLTVVLAVMALITWVLKRVMPSIANNKQSVVRVVGGASVGSRERVVVVEIADRWLVLGVSAGQVNGIANLEAGSLQPSGNVLDTHSGSGDFTQSFAPSFAQWLKKSTAKFVVTKPSEKPNAKE